MAKDDILLTLPEFIFGREGEEDGTDGEQNSSAESGNDSGEQNGTAGSSSEGSQEQNSNDDEAAALRRALEAERKLSKDREKQLKAFQKKQQEAEDAERSESEREKLRAEKAETALTKLAQGYRTEKLHSAIRNAAGDFVDADDVIAAIERDGTVGVEQDEDDPSLVTIDQATLQAAIKKLSTSKPHWLKTGTSDGERTGSKFGNGRGSKKPSGDEALMDRYPALRH